jgi:hypothetical protein
VNPRAHHGEETVPTRRTLLLSAAALTVLVATTGCSLLAGPATTQERAVASVTGVRLETSGTLSITPGDTPALTVTAGSAVVGQLTSDVVDGVLVLGLTDRGSSLGDVRYALTLPRLDSLVVTGSGRAVVESVPSDSLSITVDGSGDVEVSGLAVDELDIELTGSGTVEAEGHSTVQAVRLEGSGDYAAISLDTRRATVTVSGSGNADVRVTGSLTAIVEGSGDIRHRGGAEVTSSVEGSGEVIEG